MWAVTPLRIVRALPLLTIAIVLGGGTPTLPGAPAPAPPPPRLPLAHRLPIGDALRERVTIADTDSDTVGRRSRIRAGAGRHSDGRAAARLGRGRPRDLWHHGWRALDEAICVDRGVRRRRLHQRHHRLGGRHPNAAWHHR